MTQGAAWGVTPTTGDEEVAADGWAETSEPVAGEAELMAGEAERAEEAEPVAASADWAEDSDQSEGLDEGIDGSEPVGGAQWGEDASAGQAREAGEALAFQGETVPQQVEGTGHPAVDAAVRAVVNAEALPVTEQLAAYEGAHQTLREVLASIED